MEQPVNEVIALSKEVGSFIRQEGNSFSADKIEYKGLNDIVSYVDKLAEQKIVTRLEKILPEAGSITEKQNRNRWANVIAGSLILRRHTSYINGLPGFSVSIALKEYNELVAGVVYEINLDE